MEDTPQALLAEIEALLVSPQFSHCWPVLQRTARDARNELEIMLVRMRRVRELVDELSEEIDGTRAWEAMAPTSIAAANK
jgi:hypothetical protein